VVANSFLGLAKIKKYFFLACYLLFFKLCIVDLSTISINFVRRRKTVVLYGNVVLLSEKKKKPMFS